MEFLSKNNCWVYDLGSGIELEIDRFENEITVTDSLRSSALWVIENLPELLKISHNELLNTIGLGQYIPSEVLSRIYPIPKDTSPEIANDYIQKFMLGWLKSTAENTEWECTHLKIIDSTSFYIAWQDINSIYLEWYVEFSNKMIARVYCLNI